MSRIPGKNKEKITFSCDIGNLKKINEAIEQGLFSSVSETVNKSITFFFENRDKPAPQDQVKVWLISEDGEAYIKNLIRKEMKNK